MISTPPPLPSLTERVRVGVRLLRGGGRGRGGRLRGRLGLPAAHDVGAALVEPVLAAGGRVGPQAGHGVPDAIAYMYSRRMRDFLCLNPK